jgi:hypothetical protein
MKTLARVAVIGLGAVAFSIAGYYFGTAQGSGTMVNDGQISLTGYGPGSIPGAYINKITAGGGTVCFVVRSEKGVAIDCP